MYFFTLSPVFCPLFEPWLEHTHSDRDSPLRLLAECIAMTWFEKHSLLHLDPGCTCGVMVKRRVKTRWDVIQQGYMKNNNLSTLSSHIGGCRVPSLSPSQGCATWGAARRRGPTGGRAKGIARNCFTLFSVPFTLTYSPLTRPSLRETTTDEANTHNHM